MMDNPQLIEYQWGDMVFRYRFTAGAELSISGIPLIYSSSLWVMSPGWMNRYYGMTDRKNIIQDAAIKESGDILEITLDHYSSPKESSQFIGKETFTLHKDNQYQVKLEGQLTPGLDGIIEWTAGTINPMLFLGEHYESTVKGKKILGSFPVTPEAEEVESATFAKGFSSMKMESRIGNILLECNDNKDIRFFDFRRNRWANPKQPQFWLGLLETPIQGGQPFSYQLNFKFSKRTKTPAKSSSRLDIRVPIHKETAVLIPNHQQEYILPQPKALQFTGTDFSITDKTRIIIPDESNEDLKRAIQTFMRELKDILPIQLTIISENNSASSGNSILTLSISNQSTRISDLGDSSLPNHQEGYSLTVAANQIQLSAHTAQGIYYGLMSLLQLIKLTPDGYYFRGVKITDYPSLDFRGIHCFTGKDRGQEIAHTVRKLMGLHKINALVWECEYLIWDSFPELAHSEYGMTKEDAQQVLQAARESFIEIIPLVQSLGHSEWIFTNGQNLEFAEDPDHPYAYNPTDSRSYNFIYHAYQEVIEFFNPKIVHIGHDEVATEGRFPWRSLASQKSVTELVMEDMRKLHHWFKERDIRIMVWGDMFLWKEEANDAANAPSKKDAFKRRELLPKDVLVADWHYAEDKPENYRSIPLFAKEGYATIGAPFDRPNNIKNLTQACINASCQGLLQTTWAGFNFRIKDNESCWNQYWAYLWAAEYSWSGIDTPADQLPYEARQLFMDIIQNKKPLLETKLGFTIPLDDYFNCTLSGAPQSPSPIGFGPELDLSEFPLDRTLWGNTVFQCSTNKHGKLAILMDGQLESQGTYPSHIEVCLESRKLSELHLLMTTTFPTEDGVQTGKVIFEYTDQTRFEKPLIYGHNIFAFNDLRPSPEARIGWRQIAPSQQLVAVWDLTVINPSPEKLITSIFLESQGTAAAPVIFAITGVLPS